MLDRVTHRKDLKDELTSILRMLMRQTPAVKGDLPPPAAEPAAEPAAGTA
jgi:acetyl-CoA carboxylase carboxyl transferase subunit beta